MNSRPHANVLMLATQDFDGLDRPLSLCVGGRSTHYRYVANQLPASCHVLADGQEVEYAYVPALGNLVRQIRAQGEAPQDYSYDPLLGLIQTRKGALGQQTTTYNASGQPSTDTWSVEGAKYLTTWHHSLCRRLLGLEDASKLTHGRAYDEHGRLCQFQIDQITCCIDYDELSRPCTHTTTDSASGQTLVRTQTFDHLGRELTRRFVYTDGNVTSTQVQTLTYTDLDQIKTRHWQEGTRQSQENYRYDVLGRLVLYTATPGITQDPFGNWVVEQSFTLNPLDGYDSVRTTFADGSSDQASYHYDNAEDPCQVTAIEHTHPSWPARISLSYDARGRLASDSLGRRLTWDAQDRVTQVEYQGQVCTYGYDPSGNLCDRQIGTQTSRAFYSADQLTHEQRGDDLIQVLSDANERFALNRLTQDVRQGVMLLGCDGQGSVCVEADSQVRHRHYTAHGAEATAPTLGDNPFGFAGERREPLTGWYIAGGYRPYDPLLLMFLAPDSASPFAEGGINAYAYCGGDPVNRIDPDGHGAWDWVKVGMGITLGVVGAVISFGALAPILAAGLSALTVSAVLSLTSATLGIISSATGVASTLFMLADKDSKAGEVLGYISLVTGWASTITGAGAKYLDWRKETVSPRGFSLNRVRSRSSSTDGLNIGTFRARTFRAGSRGASTSPSLSLRTPSGSPVSQGAARALNNPNTQLLETPGIEMDVLNRPGTLRTGSTSTGIGPRTPSPSPSPSPSVSSADVASSPPPRPGELSTAGHTPPPHNRFGQLSADTNGAGSPFAARGSASQRPPVERLFGYYYSMGHF